MNKGLNWYDINARKQGPAHAKGPARPIKSNTAKSFYKPPGTKKEGKRLHENRWTSAHKAALVNEAKPVGKPGCKPILQTGKKPRPTAKQAESPFGLARGAEINQKKLRPIQNDLKEYNKIGTEETRISESRSAQK